MIFRPNMYMQPIYNPKEKAILYPKGIKYTQTDPPRFLDKNPKIPNKQPFKSLQQRFI